MAVAFPTGYNLERSSTFEVDNNIVVDTLDDGSQATRVLGDVAWTTIDARFVALTQTDMNTLVSFLETNRADDITWTVDGVDYIGRLTSPVRRTMSGNLYNVSFTYRAKEN